MLNLAEVKTFPFSARFGAIYLSGFKITLPNSRCVITRKNQVVNYFVAICTLFYSYLTTTRREVQRASLPRKTDIDLCGWNTLPFCNRLRPSRMQLTLISTDIHSSIRAAICGFKIRAAEAHWISFLHTRASLALCPVAIKASKGQNTLESFRLSAIVWRFSNYLRPRRTNNSWEQALILCSPNSFSSNLSRCRAKQLVGSPRDASKKSTWWVRSWY